MQGAQGLLVTLSHLVPGNEEMLTLPAFAESHCFSASTLSGPDSKLQRTPGCAEWLTFAGATDGSGEGRRLRAALRGALALALAPALLGECPRAAGLTGGASGVAEPRFLAVGWDLCSTLGVPGHRQFGRHPALTTCVVRAASSYLD